LSNPKLVKETMTPTATTLLDDIPADRISDQDFIVFGGSFDPIHEGHAAVLKRLLARFNEVVLAPTPQNPWKESKPAPIDLRIEMIRAVLAAENIAESTRFKAIRPTEEPSVFIECFPYLYSVELVRHLRGMTSRHFWWAVGADSASEVERWKDWAEQGVPVAVVPVDIDVHSTSVRQGSNRIHPAAESIARRAGCYPTLILSKS
jgi:cytidyltransferase-like protein